MNGLERIATALQHKEADRVPAGPLVCGAARRVYGVTYEEWAQDGELQAKCMIQAQKLIGMDGCLQLVDLSVEAADLGQEMVFPLGLPFLRPATEECQRRALLIPGEAVEEKLPGGNRENPAARQLEEENTVPSLVPRVDEVSKECASLVESHFGYIPQIGDGAPGEISEKEVGASGAVLVSIPGVGTFVDS